MGGAAPPAALFVSDRGVPIARLYLRQIRAYPLCGVPPQRPGHGFIQINYCES